MPAHKYQTQKGTMWYAKINYVDPITKKSTQKVKRGFAYPNNRRTPETDKFLFERFDYLRSGWYPSVDPIYYPVKEMTGKMVLRGGGIGEFYKTDPDVLKKRLSEAAANNCMIVFFSHNIYPHAPKIHMPTEWLEVILQHAQKLGMSISGINELPDAVKACSGN